MRTHSQISAVALAAALLATPQAAQAQLSLDLGLGGSGSGGLGVNVGVGAGDTQVGVDATVGGDSLVGVDANVGTGSSSSGQSSSSSSTDVLDLNLDVGSDDQLIDADIDLLGNDGAPLIGDDTEAPIDVDLSIGGSGGQASSEPLAGIRLSALDNTVRLDALVEQFNQPGLGGIALDEIIDDTRVSIIAVSELLGEDNLAEVDALIETGGAGRDELLAAIEASVELGSILDREGVAIQDVLSIYVGAGGETEILVLDAEIDLANLGGSGDGLLDGTELETDLANLDIDLLTDEELALVDLSLLPNEEQRLDAVIRILGRDNAGGGSTGGPIQVIDLDALLGDESLAEVDAILDSSDGNDVLITASLLEQLEELGLSPDAVVAIRDTDNGTQVLVNAGLGDTAIADVDVDLGSGSTGSGGLLDGTELETGLADLDIDLLTDEELALIDLNLLPNEEQRLEALIRILGRDTPSDGNSTGPIQVIDLDALLGDESLAEIDAVLDSADGDDVLITADLLDQLDELGLSPDAVVAVRQTPDNVTQVLINAGLGDTALADVDVNLGLGSSDGADDGTGTGGTGGNGNGGTGNGGTGSGGTGGTGTGGTGTGGTGSGGTGTGGTGTGGTGSGGTGGSGSDGTGGTGTGGGSGTGGTGGGSGTGNGGTGSGGTGTGSAGTGGTGSGGAGTGGNGATGFTGSTGTIVNGNGALTDGLPAALLEADLVVADVSCEAGLAALSMGEPLSAVDVDDVSVVELIRIQGCAQVLSQQQVAALRLAIEAQPALLNTVEDAGLSLDQLVGGNVEGDRLTLFFDEDGTEAA